MKAAIYTRFSTEKQDSNSTAAQVRNCKALIKREGWQLVDTFGDEGISGSDNERPDYRRLLAAAEEGKFDVIVVDETSRLTRAPGELQQQLAWLKFRDQFLVDCRGFDSRQNGASLIAAVGGFMDEQELEKIRHRTRRGQREVVLLDLSPGGRAYGYSSEPVQTEGKRRWRVIVVPDQAEVVQRIFQRYAAGDGLKAIADSLNRDGIASPGSTWNRTERRCAGWMHSAVRVILRNERYTGKLLWNTSRWIKVPFSSKRKREMRPREEWVVREVPELRIVSDELWESVKARFESPSRRKRAKAQKRRRGRPPRHLLSGLMVCETCGANMIIESRGRYACSSRTNGGSAACDNHLRVDGLVAEEALLSGIQERLLADEKVSEMQRLVRRRVRELSGATPAMDAGRIRGELRKVEAKLQRVADAIEVTGITDTLASRLKALESRKKELALDLDQAKSREPAKVDLPDIIPGLVQRYRQMVAEIGQLGRNPKATSEDVQRARGVLSGLFGRIRVEPRGDVLVAKVTATGAGLLGSSPASINTSFVVAGAGFEPATFGL